MQTHWERSGITQALDPHAAHKAFTAGLQQSAFPSPGLTREHGSFVLSELDSQQLKERKNDASGPCDTNNKGCGFSRYISN